MSKLGFMDEIIDAVLNHVKQGILTFEVTSQNTTKKALTK
jgi:methyltransferase-like protein